MTSTNFPVGVPTNFIQNTVVMGNAFLNATLLFFRGNNREVLTIGAGAVIDQNPQSTFSSFVRTSVLVNDTTLWISFGNSPQSNPVINGDGAFVIMIDEQ